MYRRFIVMKGLERRAVVVVVNEKSALERSRERLYVGLSRALDGLVVCGDPDFIREVGGPDLACRLNLPSKHRVSQRAVLNDLIPERLRR